MNGATLPLVVTPRFMDRVANMEQYLGGETPARGRDFVSNLLGFLQDTVQQFSLAFPIFSLPQQPELLLRRAIFRRHYSIVYEVTEDEIKCLTFFANSQDISRLIL